MRETKVRKDIIEIGGRMYAQGMAPGQDGNISVRLNDKEILVTASRVAKGFMSPSHVIKLDMEGNVLDGQFTPSVETSMHLAVYNAYPRINAAIHVHPVFTIVLSISDVRLTTKVLPEIATIFGNDIPVAEYVTPGTSAMGDVLVPLMKESDLVIQERHGLFSAGANLFEAWYRADQIENCAKVLYYAHQRGPVSELPSDEVARLIDVNKRIPPTPPETTE